MESAIWILPVIILSWPVVVLIINTIVLVVTKEPGQDANGQVRRTKSIFASKKIIGYAAAFLLPINFALTFLIYTLYGNLVPGADQWGDFLAPSDSVWMSVFVFIGLYLLGLILGVLGVAIIFFEEKDRRYTMIASVGLLSHVLFLVVLPIAFSVMALMVEAEQNPAKIIERATDKKKVDLSHKYLTSVKELENLTQLTFLNLNYNQLTDVKGLENLTQLKDLSLNDNPDLTKTQIAELQKALPNCKIDSNPSLTKEESAKIIEKAIRKAAKKPTGDLTEADLEKVTYLYLHYNQLTDIKGLEKLTQLKTLYLSRKQLTDVKGLEKLTKLETLNLNNNADLTKAQIDELQKALPKCKILSNPTK